MEDNNDMLLKYIIKEIAEDTKNVILMIFLRIIVSMIKIVSKIY